MSDYKEEYKGSWIGVDFDGTLAEYHGWEGPGVLGKPINEMVRRIAVWLADGETVKIITARVSPSVPPGKEHYAEIARTAIVEWCRKYIGRELEIVHSKDYLMREMWDDRCVQVEFNTGVPLRTRLAQAEEENARLRKAVCPHFHTDDIKECPLGDAVLKGENDE
jgi:hypothetical protein